MIFLGPCSKNKGLREKMSFAISEELPTMKLIVPPLRLCGDNAAMIGAAAHIELQKHHFAEMNLNANPSLAFQHI